MVSYYTQLYQYDGIINRCFEALCSVAQNQLDEPMPEWPVIVLDGVLENLQSMDNKKEASLLLDVLTEFAVCPYPLFFSFFFVVSLALISWPG